MQNIRGRYICGTVSGSTFADAQRPIRNDAGEIACPRDYLPCIGPPEGSGDSLLPYADSTICYKEVDGKEAQCPITDIQFILREQRPDFERLGYTVIGFDAKQDLAYSKLKR